jgi:hypothetical protein
MDGIYEGYICQMLNARLEVARRIVAEKKRDEPNGQEEASLPLRGNEVSSPGELKVPLGESTALSRKEAKLPFEVNKLMSYIKQDQYLRQRKKKLKNVTPE